MPASTPLAEAVRRADEAGARAIVVVDHENKPIAIVNESAVMATPTERRPWVDVGTLARTIDPSLVLNADIGGMALLDALRRAPRDRVPADRGERRGLRGAGRPRPRPGLRRGLTVATLTG